MDTSTKVIFKVKYDLKLNLIVFIFPYIIVHSLGKRMYQITYLELHTQILKHNKEVTQRFILLSFDIYILNVWENNCSLYVH